MATWSISVRTGSAMCSRLVMTSEQGDLIEVLLAECRVRDAEAFLGSEAQHADLPLDEIPVHLRSRLARLVEWVHGRQRRMDLSLAHEPVGVPRLAVVREVAALERLEHHPEVPVVVLDRVSRGCRARDDHPSPLAHEHGRAHRLAPRVLEHDVGVGARELADLLAEAAPLAGILGVLVLPELRSEEHTSELQSQSNLVCRLLLEKKNKLESECINSKNQQHSTSDLRCKTAVAIKDKQPAGC